MSITQKITSTKPGANFASLEDAINEIKSILDWDGTCDATNTSRTIVGTTTVIETRVWDEDAFTEYTNKRVTEGIFQTNTTKMSDAGWVVTEEVDNVLRFSH